MIVLQEETVLHINTCPQKGLKMMMLIVCIAREPCEIGAAWICYFVESSDELKRKMCHLNFRVDGSVL